MGLKTYNYEIKELGITLPTAYARLTDVSLDMNGTAFGLFKIHQNREDIESKLPFEKININMVINKDLPVHKQMYEYAKNNFFLGWKDDIVE